MQILAVSYSQSGDTARVEQALLEPLRSAGAAIDSVRVEMEHPFPFPWRSLIRFFDVLPECLLGPPPPTKTRPFDPDTDYDLVILLYQVWFLAPSLPIQGFLASPAARVLTGRKVITVSVSRNMWHSASLTMKRLLARLDARLIDNVVVTHQGPVWATFVTAPRLLLYGKKEPWLGIFPAAGIAESQLERVRRYGSAIAERREALLAPEPRSLLRGLGAVQLERRYLLPELCGWYLFQGWARVLKGFGRVGRWLRLCGLALFMLFLVAIVVCGIPLLVVLRLLLRPLVDRATRTYAERLCEPSGAAQPATETKSDT